MDTGVAELPRGLVALWVALVGASVGSFLNVVIARVPAGVSIVHPPSRCPRCGTSIRWFDNLPVISWLLLRARCRACRAPISARYPIVELAGAAIALLAWQRHGLVPAAAAELVLGAMLLALAAIDLDTWLLPHVLTWPLIGAGLLATAAGISEAPSLRSSVLGAGAGFAAFAAVAWVGKLVARREALGFGDVWLLAGIGAWLGVSALLPVVLLASIQGSVVGLVLLALGRAQTGAATLDEPPAPPAPTSETPGDGAEPAALADDDWVPPRHAIPFGPFLAAAALEWLWLGGVLARLAPGLRVFR